MPPRVIRRIAALLSITLPITLAMAACQADKTDRAGNLIPGDATPGTYWQGDRSLAAERAYVVARNAQEWTDLWARVGDPAPAGLPGDRIAVAVFLGPRDTAGYAVAIDRAQMAGGDLQVGFRERVPGPAQTVASSQTSPYAIRLLPRVEGTPKFHRDK